MYRRSLESRMRSGTWRGVSKWSRCKDRYIGRLYSAIGKVLSDSDIFRSTGELREYGEEYWALMGFSGKEPGGGARPSQAQSELDKGFGARPPSPFLLHSPPFPPSPSWTRKEGVLLPVGVGLPFARPLLGRPPLLPCSFIYGGRGTP